MYSKYYHLKVKHQKIPALFYFYVSSISYIIVYLSYISTQILNFVIRSLSLK